jgi:hypothetical protein
MPRGGRRSALRRARLSMFNSRMVRTRVLRCMPNIRAALLLFQLTSRRTTRINCFLNSSSASKYRMPVLCIRRTKVSSSDFVAYVCFRPMLNPEKLLHSAATKSLGACATPAECDARGYVYRFPTLAWSDGQLRKKGAFRCESLIGPSRQWKQVAEPRRKAIRRFDDCSAAFVVKLNFWIEASSESTVNRAGHVNPWGFSETDCLPARPSSWRPRFLS